MNPFLKVTFNFINMMIYARTVFNANTHTYTYIYIYIYIYIYMCVCMYKYTHIFNVHYNTSAHSVQLSTLVSHKDSLTKQSTDCLKSMKLVLFRTMENMYKSIIHYLGKSKLSMGFGFL